MIERSSPFNNMFHEASRSESKAFAVNVQAWVKRRLAKKLEFGAVEARRKKDN
jgi:hypothetical protein